MVMLLIALLSVMQRVKYFKQRRMSGAVVVAQLVERSLPIPEVRGSNPVIGKKLYIVTLNVWSNA